MGLILFVALGQGLVFGVASGYLAREKGKDPTAWFWYGFLFGIVGFLVIAVTPTSRRTHLSDNHETGAVVRAPSNALVSVATLPVAIDLHSPVEIRDIGLVIDDNASTVDARPVFFNVSDKTVTAIKFSTTGHDTFGDLVGSAVEAVFQDESAQPGRFLSTNKQVRLFPATRKADVLVTRVAFSDGTIWEKGDYPLVTLSPQPICQADLERLQQVVGSDASCYGLLAEKHWVCVCGRHNLLATPLCRRCHRSKDDVLAKFSRKEWIDKALLDEQERAAAQEAMRLEDQKLACARWMKIAKVAGGVVLVTVVALFTVGLLKDYLSLRNGKALLSSGQFDDALAAFAGLDGRFGADDLMVEATFEKGMSLLERGQYDQALGAFKAISHRSGLSDTVNETHYRKARSLFESGDYVAANELFNTIAEYKDTRNYLAKWQEYQYENALALLEKGRSSEALDEFRKITGYKDSQTKIYQTEYDNALERMKAGQYQQAQKIFQQIETYLDSASLLKESKYQEALSDKSNLSPVITSDSKYNIDGMKYWEHNELYTRFRKLRGYKDVDAILADSYFLHVLANTKWASEDGAFYLELREPTLHSLLKTDSNRAVYGIYMFSGAPSSMPMWHLEADIYEVRGNQLIYEGKKSSTAFTVVILDQDTIRVTINGATATLIRTAVARGV